MKIKNIITTTLLLFVVGSLAYMFLQPSIPRDTSSAQIEPADESALQNGIVMYYFSQGKECSTCDKLESYAHETLQMHFKQDLDAGILAWRKVNMDEKEHEHFVTDFDLFSKSIVLVEYKNGEQVRWKNLKEIWDLVYDKENYVEFIRTETQNFKDAAP